MYEYAIIYTCIYLHMYMLTGKCVPVFKYMHLCIYVFQMLIYAYDMTSSTPPFNSYMLVFVHLCLGVRFSLCAHVCVCADTVHGVSDSRTHIRTVHICISSRILPHPPRLMPCVREREREWYIYMYRRESKSARERARACIMMSLQGCIHTLLHTFVQQLIFAQNLSQNDYLSRL